MSYTIKHTITGDNLTVGTLTNKGRIKLIKEGLFWNHWLEGFRLPQIHAVKLTVKHNETSKEYSCLPEVEDLIIDHNLQRAQYVWSNGEDLIYQLSSGGCLFPKTAPTREELLTKAAQAYADELISAKTIEEHQRTWLESVFIHAVKSDAARKFWK